MLTLNSSIFLEDFYKILPVIPQTLILSIVLLFLGMLVGAVIAQGRISPRPWLKRISGAYIAYFRGIPLVIHLFIVYYGLPVLLTAILPPLFGVSTVKLQRLNPLYAIIIAYTLYTAAFMSEIIRGAYQAVDRQQLDAAQALGYTSWQTYRFIKLPQALVEALPKLLNYYLLLIRQLSLAFLVSFIDIFAQAQLQSAVNYRYIESYCAAALTYWLIGIVLTLLFGWWEKRLRKYQLNH